MKTLIGGMTKALNFRHSEQIETFVTTVIPLRFSSSIMEKNWMHITDFCSDDLRLKPVLSQIKSVD